VSKTDDNLQEAFAGESQANRQYLAFAKKADRENMPMVARLFRAAADAETVHAMNHLRVMRGVGSTLDNLKAGAEGEAEEFRQMYPAFIEQAAKDGNEKAEETFDYANQVEEIHHGLWLRQHRRGRAAGQVPHLRRAQEDVPEDRLRRPGEVRSRWK